VESRATPPGWYADPRGRFEYRYFNGVQWTSDVSINGQRYVDSEQPASYRPVRPSRGMAIAAFVTGISSVVVGWIPFIFVLAAGAAVAAIVFGIIGLRHARRNDGAGRSFAIAGVILGPIGLGTCVGGLFLTLLVWHEFDHYIHPGPHRLVVGDCSDDNGRATLTGTIRNDDDRDHDYNIVVEFTPSSGSSHRSTVALRDVGAGDTADWTASTSVATSTVTCRVVDVFGPKPFDNTG
jgi:hypothetical protein